MARGAEVTGNDRTSSHTSLMTHTRLLLLPRTPFVTITSPNLNILLLTTTGSRFRDFFLSTLLTCSFSLTRTYDYERYGVPFRKGKHWYYSYNEGLRAQAVYYTVQGDAIDTREKGKIFFDPSTLSDDGTLAVWPFLLRFSLTHS